MFLFKNRRLRRAIGFMLIFAGGLLMWLAPEIHAGAILFATGILFELVGIKLEQKQRHP